MVAAWVSDRAILVKERNEMSSTSVQFVLACLLYSSSFVRQNVWFRSFRFRNLGNVMQLHPTSHLHIHLCQLSR